MFVTILGHPQTRQWLVPPGGVMQSGAEPLKYSQARSRSQTLFHIIWGEFVAIDIVSKVFCTSQSRNCSML